MSTTLSHAGKRNAFKGVEVEPDVLPADPEVFRLALQQALADWTAEGLLLVWVKIAKSQAAHIPVAVKQGFRFHHSQPEYVLLTRPLVENPLIPPYATHYIGVGGVVVDDHDNLLVVSETYRQNLDRPFWKLPGGLLDPGEHLVHGVQREVWEETAIETALEHLVGMWHGHQYFFGKSGIYIVFRLRPLTLAITKDDGEIEECRWMPLAEYMVNPDVSDFNRAIVKAGMHAPALQVTTMNGYPRPEQHEFFFPPPHTHTKISGRP